MEKELTCPHCKHTGQDVHSHLVHVGGEGEVLVQGCDDIVACWWRWDKQNEVKDAV